MGVMLKRVYEPPTRADGMRILVDRLWPRGLSKDKTQKSRSLARGGCAVHRVAQVVWARSRKNGPNFKNATGPNFKATPSWPSLRAVRQRGRHPAAARDEAHRRWCSETAG